MAKNIVNYLEMANAIEDFVEYGDEEQELTSYLNTNRKMTDNIASCQSLPLYHQQRSLSSLQQDNFKSIEKNNVDTISERFPRKGSLMEVQK